ncbi:hypothetical protein [Aureimonas phyllosphaerae]|uniref:Uncharacterized protein n=1 Tax=Aureimonas phyllosphaerae TaxID=1166078 RepID=A0A7W6BU25_9HYPH|nr:hypothetical protein [Aureimonas phyllosphaerae]MBB3938033.1 hypothetical protein [Aureimonas phyllosphaerae]MBB3962040.1 hypothetical protein [Aureimonas phyllosphaerae]SFF54143.1 hypothetical protein SAMN05216566_12440 [Aureimonas phyllosphaerae]
MRFPPEGYRAALRNPISVDFSNAFSLEAMAEGGFEHLSIGCGSVEAAEPALAKRNV